MELHEQSSAVLNEAARSLKGTLPGNDNENLVSGLAWYWYDLAGLRTCAPPAVETLLFRRSYNLI